MFRANKILLNLQYCKLNKMSQMPLYGFGQDSEDFEIQVKNKKNYGLIYKDQKNQNQGSSKLPDRIRKDFQIQQNHQFPQQDQDFIYRVMIQILKYPDQNEAELHRLANRMGRKDLKAQKQKVNQKQQEPKLKSNQMSKLNIVQVTQQSLNDQNQTNQKSSKAKQQEICPCCGFIKQDETIPSCVAFQEFPTVGLSTYLFFRSMTNVSILLTILFIVYGLFSIYINYDVTYRALGKDIISGLGLIPDYYYVIFSYKAMELNFLVAGDTAQKITYVMAILILIVVIIWSFCVYLFKHNQLEYKQLIDDNSATASDFAIMIQHAPKQLFADTSFIQKQFQQYFQQISQCINKQYFDIYLKKNNPNLSYEQQLSKLKMLKINIGIPFYLNDEDSKLDKEYEYLQQKYQQHKDKLIEWTVQFFENKKLNVQHQKRQKRLKELKEFEQRMKAKKEEFTKQLQAKYKQQTSTQLTTTVFATFSSAIAAKIVYELNPCDFLSKIRYVLSCCSSKNLLNLKNKQGETIHVKISRAPQPEDIVWQNIGVSQCKIFSRRMMTYFVTTAILVGSFWLIEYLSDIQLKTNDNLVSVGISIAITFLNMGIGQIIMILTAFEMDFTQTNHQASLALKSIVAQLINSIAIPVFIKRDNVYGDKGLVEDVFFLAFTTALFGPIFKFFDVFYLYARLVYWYKSRPYPRIGINQEQLNGYAQQTQFQIGFEYIYVADLFLITCFYTYLQPVIPIISMIGLFLMYWVSKYCLLNRSKRPIPGDNTISATVGQIINLGPIMLGLGAFVFTDILSDHGDGSIKFLLHLIAIGIGLILYLLPFQTIYRIIFSQDEVFYNLDYYESRVILPSEYDRCNPATSQQGMKDFKTYLKELNNVLNNDNTNDTNNKINTQKKKRIIHNIQSFFQQAKKNPRQKKALKLLKVQGFGPDLNDDDQRANNNSKIKSRKRQGNLQQKKRSQKKISSLQQTSPTKQVTKYNNNKPNLINNQSSVHLMDDKNNSKTAQNQQLKNNNLQPSKIKKANEPSVLGFGVDNGLKNDKEDDIQVHKQSNNDKIKTNTNINNQDTTQNPNTKQQLESNNQSNLKKKTYQFSQSSQSPTNKQQKFNMSRLKENKKDDQQRINKSNILIQTPISKKQDQELEQESFQIKDQSNKKLLANNSNGNGNNNNNNDNDRYSQSKQKQKPTSDKHLNQSLQSKPQVNNNNTSPSKQKQQTSPTKPNKLFTKPIQILGFGVPQEQQQFNNQSKQTQVKENVSKRKRRTMPLKNQQQYNSNTQSEDKGIKNGYGIDYEADRRNNIKSNPYARNNNNNTSNQ